MKSAPLIALFAAAFSCSCKRRTSNAALQAAPQTELNLFVDYDNERFSVGQQGESCGSLCTSMNLASTPYRSQERQYCIALRDAYVQNNAALHLRASQQGGEGDAETAGAPCSLFSADYSNEVEYLFARKSVTFNHDYKNDKVRVICLCK